MPNRKRQSTLAAHAHGCACACAHVRVSERVRVWVCAGPMRRRSSAQSSRAASTGGAASARRSPQARLVWAWQRQVVWRKTRRRPASRRSGDGALPSWSFNSNQYKCKESADRIGCPHCMDLLRRSGPHRVHTFLRRFLHMCSAAWHTAPTATKTAVIIYSPAAQGTGRRHADTLGRRKA
jgi:hypothetical protein